MIKQSDIIGKPVIDKFGNKVSKIEKIIYSKSRARVLALSIRKSKLLKKYNIIEFRDIHCLGKDAIVLKSNKSLKSLSLDIYFSDSNILEQEILSVCGKSLGFIKDIVIDSESGFVIGFILTQGLFEDINSGRNIFPLNEKMIFGKDNIIIDKHLKDDYIRNKKDYKKLLELL